MRKENYHIIVNLLFFSTFSECKLSRSGPPATIVAIDEESPNGKVPYLLSLLLISAENISLTEAFHHKNIS